jgi:hypothetical protein
LRECYGVVSMQAGFVQSLGLSIEPDRFDHANILDLPLDNDRGRDGRRRAGQLAKHCRYVTRPSKKVAQSIWDRFRDRVGSEPVAMWHFAGDDPDPGEYWTAKFSDGTTQRISVAELAAGS